MNIKKRDVFTIPQAAKYCAVDRVTMWRWVKSGKIPVSVTPGGHHRIRVEDLDEFLRTTKMGPLAQKHFPRNRILIVDDDIMVQKSLSKALESRNFEVETASDGFEAGMKVLDFSPDVLVLDLIMPGMDGFEVCNQIKSNPKTEDIKVIILTGYDSAENREQIMNAGADKYLVKPQEEEVIFKHIKSLIKKRYGKSRDKVASE